MYLELNHSECKLKNFNALALPDGYPAKVNPSGRPLELANSLQTMSSGWILYYAALAWLMLCWLVYTAYHSDKSKRSRRMKWWLKWFE